MNPTAFVMTAYVRRWKRWTFGDRRWIAEVWFAEDGTSRPDGMRAIGDTCVAGYGRTKRQAMRRLMELVSS